MTVKMILAADEGNSIGWLNGQLPWKISPDMKRFKDLTTGHTVLMGMTTFKSLGRPNGLPNRENIVLSRRPFAEAKIGLGDDVLLLSSIDDIAGLLETRTHRDIWIIGGATVYAQALEKQLVDEIYFTQVHTLSGGDVTVPFDLHSWKLFIIRQRELGVNWELTSAEDPPVPADCPRITFMHFKKTT